MTSMHELLVRLQREGGSDLHMAAGREPRMRKRGSLEPVAGVPSLADAELRALMREVTDEAHWREYERDGDLDFAHGIPGVARFRCNYFVQERGAGAVFRIIPEKIQTLADLELPPAIGTLAQLDQGLVLVTGPTGSGKSTTLAAIIDAINESKPRHILTIEDPIEFVHTSKKCVFSQREVGIHSKSFGTALRAALRADADVILVGEMRDYETISLALTAAEMGALVFGTLHTNSAMKTIDRVIDAFPSDEQPQARLSLSESLAGVVSQLLIRTADGKGRRAANEILLRTSGLANIIREGNTPMLSNLIQAGKQQGMQTMDDSLFTLVKERGGDPEDAWHKAMDKSRFEPMLSRL